MDANYIFFNPREWFLIQGEGGNARYDRFFADHPVRGGMTEMVEMSNFGNRYTRIGRILHLEKDTTYHFVFWLNGGENDAGTEVCNLLVFCMDDADAELSRDDWERRYIYRLNRSYIKPVKRCRGWELYDIPFRTGERENVLLCFEVDKAPMAIVHADSVESYGDLEDWVDEFAAKRPQRHNIVFAEGWPSNAWYSTEALLARAAEENIRNGGDYGALASLVEKIAEGICENHMEEICQGVLDNIRDDIVEEIRDEVADEIRDDIVEEIRDEILEEIQDEIGQG